MNLVYKGTGEKGIINFFRLVAVSPDLYGIAMEVLERIMQELTEEEEIFGKLQNTFISGRTLEDNLSALMGHIEILEREQHLLRICMIMLSRKNYRTHCCRETK